MPTATIDLTNLDKATNDKYYPYFWNDARFLVLYGGAGSGKSEFAALKLLYRILSEDGHRLLCVRKVAKTLRHSVFALLVEVIDRHDWRELFKVYKSELKIECANGNEILFAGLDDPEKLKSITGVTGIWVEEATDLAADDLDQLNLRLRGMTPGYKQIILSFNPVSALHWLKKRMFDTKPDNADILHSTYRDNRFIDDEYKAELEALAAQNPNFHKIYALGEWGLLKGVIYRPFDTEAKWPKEFADKFYGLDFGYNHASALVRIEGKDGEPWLTEEIYDTGLTNTDLIAEMNRLGIDKRAIIYADSAEPDRIKEIERAGYRIKPADKGPGTVATGIDYCQSLTIHTKPENVNLNKEVQTYAWREDKHGNPMDEPVKFADHAMDALRYGLWTHWGKPRKRVDFSELKGIRRKMGM